MMETMHFKFKMADYAPQWNSDYAFVAASMGNRELITQHQRDIETRSTFLYLALNLLFTLTEGEPMAFKDQKFEVQRPQGVMFSEK